MESGLVGVRVDDRELRSAVVERLRDHGGLDVCIQRMEVGDYLVGGTVLFERKTAADFAASLIDGRLFAQASRLAKSPYRGALVIEGDGSDWARLGVSREAIQGALISLMLIFGLPVFRSRDEGETARILIYAGGQLRRCGQSGSGSGRMAKGSRKSPRQLRVLQSLPGVGRGRARRLLDRFGSIRVCLAATVEELESVEGVGRKTAEAIVETVG